MGEGMSEEQYRERSRRPDPERSAELGRLREEQRALAEEVAKRADEQRLTGVVAGSGGLKIRTGGPSVSTRASSPAGGEIRGVLIELEGNAQRAQELARRAARLRRALFGSEPEVEDADRGERPTDSLLSHAFRMTATTNEALGTIGYFLRRLEDSIGLPDDEDGY